MNLNMWNIFVHYLYLPNVQSILYTVVVMILKYHRLLHVYWFKFVLN